MSYAQPMPYGQAKPNYPPPQAAYGPPPTSYGQGNTGSALPPSMAGQFQGESLPPQIAPPQNYGQQPYNPPIDPNFSQGGYPSQPSYPPQQMSQGGLPQSQGAYPPTQSFSQPPPAQQQQQPAPRIGQGAGGRPDGPAFTGAGNPAYSTVTPVPGQGQQYNMGGGPPAQPSGQFNAPAAQQTSAGNASLNEANATFQITLIGEKLARKDVFSKSDPYVQFISAGGDVVYKSEVIMNDQSPKWKPFKLSLARLGGSRDQPFTVEVWDYDKNSKGDFIGKAVMTMRDLMNPGASFQLANTHGFHIQNPGKIIVANCTKV